MTDIPERLRERAKALEIDVVHGAQEFVEGVATALHEVEQAAEQRGIERGGNALASLAVAAREFMDHAEHELISDSDYDRDGVLAEKAARLHNMIWDIEHPRALPAPAEPAKGA